MATLSILSELPQVFSKKAQIDYKWYKNQWK